MDKKQDYEMTQNIKIKPIVYIWIIGILSLLTTIISLFWLIWSPGILVQKILMTSLFSTMILSGLIIIIKLINS